MATGQSSSTTPSVFNFLKEGLLLPRHNPRLFATILTIIVASSCLLHVVNDLTVQPLRDEIHHHLDTKALNNTHPSSPEDILQLIQKTQDGTGLRTLWLTRLFGIIIRSAIQMAVLFAAVATYSGELLTFGSLLGKIKIRLKGLVLTLAFLHALDVAYVELFDAMSRLLMFLLSIKYIWLSVVVSVFVVLPWPFIDIVYDSFLCPLSVVVAVAEPDCHGTGALGRAWRLVKGKRGRAMLFISVTVVLSIALTHAYNLAKRWELTSMAAGGLLLEFPYTILTSAMQLFEACAMAAFYYECKGRSAEASEVEYVKVSID